MRLAYFDCFSGVSGDMALGALVHAGADLDEITKALSAFPIDDFGLDAKEVDVRGMPALTVHIHTAATVHTKDPELVTFHESGDVDCLVAFVGCALAMEALEVDRIF